MEQYIPQIIYLMLSISGVMISIGRHGEPRTPENGWHAVIAAGIGWTLLYLGGFFG